MKELTYECPACGYWLENFSYPPQCHKCGTVMVERPPISGRAAYLWLEENHPPTPREEEYEASPATTKQVNYVRFNLPAFRALEVSSRFHGSRETQTTDAVKYGSVEVPAEGITDLDAELAEWVKARQEQYAAARADHTYVPNSAFGFDGEFTPSWEKFTVTVDTPAVNGTRATSAFAAWQAEFHRLFPDRAAREKALDAFAGGDE